MITYDMTPVKYMCIRDMGKRYKRGVLYNLYTESKHWKNTMAFLEKDLYGHWKLDTESTRFKKHFIRDYKVRENKIDELLS